MASNSNNRIQTVDFVNTQTLRWNYLELSLIDVENQFRCDSVWRTEDLIDDSTGPLT